MYLEVLAGGGLVAGAAFVWLFGRAARVVASGLRRTARRLDGAGPWSAAPDAVAWGVAAAAIAIALHATVDSFLSFAPTYVLFSLTLGCAVACARGAEDADADRV
jgi:O-antigen ligase